MTPTLIDHAVQARSLVATQYVESAKFLSTLAAVMAQVQDLENALLSLQEISDVDTAEGVNLDVIGDIVGVTRYIPASVLIPFFGFSDTLAGLTFGEEGSAGIGGRLYDDGEPYVATSVLADPEYRLLIKAKIIKNHAIGTNNDVIEGLNFIFSGTLSVVEDNGGMKVDIGIGRPITYTEKILVRQLDILPRPAGVKLDIVVSFNAEAFFGFADQANAKGFGEEGDPSIGGTLTEEF